jgi:hypothetical protein
MNALRIMVAGSALWAFMLLTFQVLTARGGGRPDFSRPAGRPAAGAWYNFTTGMLPWNKESAWLHLAEFGLGIVFHAGVLLTLASVFIMAATPTFGARLLALLWPLNALSLAAGIALLIRRVRSELLRAISVPDDYLAVSVTCGLLIVALAFSFFGQNPGPPLAYTSLLLIYLPLGKLRHAVFFFVARTNYGCRLGHRGVYPPPRSATE